MSRRAALLLLAFAPLAAFAAPVPPESDAAKLRRIYGEVVDPDKDCAFELKGEKLRIGIPDTHHSMCGNPGLMNAPRLVREIEGNFIATVRVTFPIRTAPGPERGLPFTPWADAGLFVYAADNDQFRVLRQEYTLGMRKAPLEQFERTLSSPKIHSCHVLRDRQQTGESVYLRLTRSGNQVSAAWSRDGKTWDEFEAVEVGWGDRVKVGVIAQNGYKAPFEATFDQYNLTQPEKK